MRHPPARLYWNRMSSWAKIPGGTHEWDVASAMLGGSMRVRKFCHAGWKRICTASRTIKEPPFSCKRGLRKRDRASEALETEGFSKRTCLPAFRALRVHS